MLSFSVEKDMFCGKSCDAYNLELREHAFMKRRKIKLASKLLSRTFNNFEFEAPKV